MSQAEDGSGNGAVLCQLCLMNPATIEGHIIPRFVFRWLKQTSSTGHVRSSENMNKRRQDGTKRPWFCSACEQRFGNTERRFASEVFHPLADGSADRFEYGPWLPYFSASVCWRLLLLRKRESGLEALPGKAQRALESAFVAWRDYLLERKPHPGDHSLHVVLLHRPSFEPGGKFPSNLHRYLLRAIDPEIVYSDTGSFVSVKLPRLAILGELWGTAKAFPKASRLRVRGGTIGGQAQRHPAGYDQHLMHRAVHSRKLREQISPKQQDRIDDTIRANPERWMESDTFSALQRDLEAFPPDLVDDEDIG